MNYTSLKAATLWFLGFVLSCTAEHAAAQTRYRSLTAGMGYSEVLQSLGAPKEKGERESRREDVWIYPKVTVVFKEGRLVSWEGTQGKKSQSANTAVAASTPRAAVTTNEGVGLEEILSEIMGSSEGDEAPTGSDVRPGGLPRTLMPPPPPPTVE